MKFLTFKKESVLNPIFVFSLILLLLNDFLFKAMYHNFVTGKLSDFAGIIVFTLFLLVFFHKQKRAVYLFVILFFSFWKSPLSGNFIDFLNLNLNFSYTRIVDYSDLFCLLLLIPLYFYEPKMKENKFVFSTLLFVGAFGIFSTSRGNMRDYGYVYVGKEVKLHAQKSDFLALLDQRQISYKLTNSFIEKRDSSFSYELQKFLINSDTIYNANITLTQKNKRNLLVKIHNIYITEKGKPLITRDYSKADSIEKMYRENAVSYFKTFGTNK